MKNIMLASMMVVVSVMGNTAGAALLKAEGTMTLDFVSPSINVETANALASVFPSDIVFTYIFDTDESVADTDPDTSKGSFPFSITNLQLNFGGYDFALSSIPCPTPTLDCRVSTSQFFGNTSIFAISQIAKSEALSADLIGLTGLLPSPFFDPSVNALFSLSKLSNNDPNIFPDLRSLVGSAGFSLFLSSPFGSGPISENRVNFVSSNVIVSDFRPVNPVPAPSSLPVIALGFILLGLRLKQQN